MTGILVVGGGVAGSATALALHKAGLDVTVYEAHPETGADIGAFLTLAGNGMRALAQIDAAEAVAELGFPLCSMRVLDGDGAEILAAPLGEPGDPLTRYRCLRRAELGAALQREVRRRGIPIRHGARLADFTAAEAGIVVTLADGSRATGELLIGADGLNSDVRALIDPAATPRYAGQRVFYGYTPDAPAAGEPADRITFVRGAAAFGYLVSPERETFWFARVSGPRLTAEEIATSSPRRLREQLLEVLRPEKAPAADIVAATGAELMVTNALDLEPGTRWRSGPALLIGDAAHAASPATGQGASMALEDAVILAKALRDADLRDTDSRDAALDLYERCRRPRVEHNIAVSAQLSASRNAASTELSAERPDQRAQPPSPPRTSAAAPSAAHADEELLRLLDWDTPLRVPQDVY